MERRSFLQSLLALFLPTPVAEELLVPAAPALAAPAAAAAASGALPCPYLVRSIAVYVSVEPEGFGGDVSHEEPFTEDAWNQGMRPPGRDHELQLMHVGHEPRHDLEGPRPDTFQEAVWLQRLSRRARGRLTFQEAASAAHGLA